MVVRVVLGPAAPLPVPEVPLIPLLPVEFDVVPEACWREEVAEGEGGDENGSVRAAERELSLSPNDRGIRVVILRICFKCIRCF